MLCNEKKYEFRNRLKAVHKKDVRDCSLTADCNEFEIVDGVRIVLPENPGKVVDNAAKDFLDYLRTSMKLFGTVADKAQPDSQNIIISLCESIDESYIISFDNNISITAKNERMASQALYCLEDRMSARRAPFLEKKEIKHTFLQMLPLQHFHSLCTRFFQHLYYPT